MFWPIMDLNQINGWRSNLDGNIWGLLVISVKRFDVWKHRIWAGIRILRLGVYWFPFLMEMERILLILCLIRFVNVYRPLDYLTEKVKHRSNSESPEHVPSGDGISCPASELFALCLVFSRMRRRINQKHQRKTHLWPQPRKFDSTYRG